eukprot:3570695-Alexandrium_andersonii.AAC.1
MSPEATRRPRNFRRRRDERGRFSQKPIDGRRRTKGREPFSHAGPALLHPDGRPAAARLRSTNGNT